MTKNIDRSQSITFICLNIEGDKHLSLVKPFLISSQSEVIFLQEVFKHTAKSLAEFLQMEYIFVPMCTRPISDKEDDEFLEWGVAIFSKYPFIDKQIFYYGVDDENEQSSSANKIPEFRRDVNGGPLIMPSRVLLYVTIEKNGQMFHLATTHFTWTPNGKDSELQHKDLVSLFRVLEEKDSLILAGDFNAPRGGIIHQKLLETFKYWIPHTVVSTLDPHLHRVKNLEYVVDHLFTRGDYQVKNINVIDGLSDHKAIVAEINGLNLGVEDVVLTKEHSIDTSVPS